MKQILAKPEQFRWSMYGHHCVVLYIFCSFKKIKITSFSVEYNERGWPESPMGPYSAVNVTGSGTSAQRSLWGAAPGILRSRLNPSPRMLFYIVTGPEGPRVLGLKLDRTSSTARSPGLPSSRCSASLYLKDRSSWEDAGFRSQRVQWQMHGYRRGTHQGIQWNTTRPLKGTKQGHLQ